MQPRVRGRHCTMLQVVEESVNDTGQKLVHFEGVGHCVHKDSVHEEVKAGGIKRSEEPEASHKQARNESNKCTHSCTHR